MLKLIYERQFAKDLKKAKKQGKNIQKFFDVITLLDRKSVV